MTYTDEQRATAPVPPDDAWRVVGSLGGDDRLYTPGALWRLRGAGDRLLGGPGFRITGPGRPLEPGDDLDFWQVEEVSPPARLRMRALSRLPGTAYLDVLVRPHGTGSELVLRTTFEPAGLPGHAYWWSTLAAHRVTFALMARRLAALVSSLN